jgi:hypothetical protein
MKQALDAIETYGPEYMHGLSKKHYTKTLRQAIAELEKQEPVVGTKTWFEDGKMVTQHLYASDISQERVDETAKHGHEPVPNDYDRSIHSNPDAQAWAKFFMATVNEQEWCIDDIDESLMTGWFANAMMAMHDHVKREWVGLDGDIPGLGLVTEEFYNGMLCAEDILRRRNT